MCVCDLTWFNAGEHQVKQTTERERATYVSFFYSFAVHFSGDVVRYESFASTRAENIISIQSVVWWIFQRNECAWWWRCSPLGQRSVYYDISGADDCIWWPNFWTSYGLAQKSTILWISSNAHNWNVPQMRGLLRRVSSTHVRDAFEHNNNIITSMMCTRVMCSWVKFIGCWLHSARNVCVLRGKRWERKNSVHDVGGNIYLNSDHNIERNINVIYTRNTVNRHQQDVAATFHSLFEKILFIFSYNARVCKLGCIFWSLWMRVCIC